MPETTDNPTLDVGRNIRPALIAGIGAAILAIIGAVVNISIFMHAYLTAYFFWLAIALGCLTVLMIQNLAGGYWGAVIRRPLEAAAATLPAMAVLFIPILLGMGSLYPWTHPGGISSSIALPQVKQIYLSVPFFIGRAVVYFAVWIIWEMLLLRWSHERDRNPTPELTARMRNFSAPGLIVIALTITFAGFDWIMSLNPNWSSSIWGAIIGTDAMLTGFAFVVWLATRWATLQPFDRLTSPRYFNSVGSLMLAFLMLWAYMSVSQLILMYAGNLPDEQIWYTTRVAGVWSVVAWFIALGHFGVPFGFLVIRDAKRNRRTLGAICLLLLFAGYVNLFWFIQPDFPGDGAWSILYNLVLAIAIGGLWLAAFAWQLNRWPIVSPTEPNIIAHMELAHER
jgi:hypothetical protein